MTTPILILALLGVGAAALCAILLARLLEVLRRLEERLDVLNELGALRELLAKVSADREDLDLRRLEHMLSDLRKEVRGAGESVVQAVSEVSPTSEVTIHPPSPVGLGERVVNRLCSMGYERIQLVTDSDVLDELAGADGEDPVDGEALFEAYRQGVLHKGRVLLRGGRVADVDVHPAYSIFP